MNWFKKNEWRKKILFISSPITAKLEETETLDYFAYIVSILSQKIENVFPNYDLVVKVPEDGGNTTDKQIKIINDAINIINKNKNEYVAVILSPYDKTKERDYVINLCNISKTLLIDQGYYTDEEIKYFKQKKVDRPPFVQSDWEQGGKIAGQLLISYLQKKAIKSPNILIVKGNIGSEERIKGFKEPLNNSSLNPSYWEPINGQYSMQITSKVFSDFYEELKSTNNKIKVYFSPKAVSEFYPINEQEISDKGFKEGYFDLELKSVEAFISKTESLFNYINNKEVEVDDE